MMRNNLCIYFDTMRLRDGSCSHPVSLTGECDCLKPNEVCMLLSMRYFIYGIVKTGEVVLVSSKAVFPPWRVYDLEYELDENNTQISEERIRRTLARASDNKTSDIRLICINN